MSVGRVSSLKSLALGAFLIGGVSLTGLGVALAQDDAAVPSHPAHIHAGTCAELDPAPKAPLDNVTVRQNEDEEDNQPAGVLTASNVLYSKSTADLSMDDILAESHAINIHLSDDEIDTYIACGDIGGVVVEDDLYVGLHMTDDSGYTGVAKLHKDGDSTEVEIFLVEPPTEEAPATPAT